MKRPGLWTRMGTLQASGERLAGHDDTYTYTHTRARAHDTPCNAENPVFIWIDVIDEYLSYG